MMAQAASAGTPLNDRKRVKVYELKNNDWYDRGTGFCAGQIVGVSHPHSDMQSGASHDALVPLPARLTKTPG